MKRPPARAPSARWICVSGCAGIGATGFAGRRSDCGTLVVRRSIRLSLHSRLLLSALETKCLNVLYKSKHATLVRWYSTARVSKRLTYEMAACLRARYCTNLTCSDLNRCQWTTKAIPSYRTPKAVAALFYACFSHNFPSRALTYCSGFGSSRAETLCLTSYFFLSYSSEVSV